MGAVDFQAAAPGDTPVHTPISDYQADELGNTDFRMKARHLTWYTMFAANKLK